MRKLLLIARQCYLHEVRKKSFLIAALSPILMVGLVVALIVVMGNQRRSDLPLGYVDQGSLLKPQLLSTLRRGDKAVVFQAFDDEAVAHAALEAGEIQAYYVVPTDFATQRALRSYYLERAPSDILRSDFSRFLRASLLANLDESVRQRASDGITLTMRTPDGRRSLSMDNPLNFVLPFVAAMMFVLSVMLSAGYLLQAVTGEKENRTIEIMVTSSSPEQLMGGKAVGLVGLSLTQLAIWLATIAVGLVIAMPFVPAIQGYRVPWDLVAVVLLYFLPGFVLVTGVMTTLGALMPDFRQGQQAAGILNLFFVSPLMVVSLLFVNVNHPLLVAMTFFPTTSFAMVAMRWSFVDIPFWQLAISWSLLVCTALASVWLSARVFRAGMLQYGRPLSLKAALSSVREARRAQAQRAEVPHA